MLRLAAALVLLAALVVGASLARAAPTNNIFTVAGTGTAGFSGDGGAATAAQLSVPVWVAATADDGYLIADQGNSRIRKVAPNGIITTVAGTGVAGFGGDGGPATAAQLSSATNGLAVTADGSILIADSNSNRVRRVSPAGTITTVAGNGTPGFNGDNIPATSASLSFPIGLSVTPDGGFLIADNDNNRIRKVSAGGTITTVAGVAGSASGGDGGPATSAGLNGPADVAVTADGGYLIADQGNNRVRKVSPGGIITTAAGTGAASFGGDGGPATAAPLNGPGNVAVTADGGYLISDRSNIRVRKVSPNGTIATVAGTGVAGFGGDGGPAAGAQINQPLGLAMTAEGDYLIADAFNNRVRLVDAGEAPPAPAKKLPKPVLGRTVNVKVVRGRVRVAVPARKAGDGPAGASQKGLRFVPLKGARQIRVGSFLDTRKGTVGLTSARDTRGHTQTGNFTSGIFQVLQSRKRRAKGLTGLVLKGGTSVRKCRSRGKKARAALSRRALRRLRGNAKGRFRTRGRYSAATVRGTKWTVADRCDGTLTKVTRGKVAVRDFRRKKTIIVKKGKRYLARARR